ncbi:MAG: DUF4231 domain-containing protein [Cyanobacteria bacterium J06621_11]
MGKKTNYRQYLKSTLGGIINKLEISALKQDFLKSRWLDQLLWLESSAARERNRYYALRLITIIGGTLVPAMVGFNGFQGGNDSRIQSLAAYAAFGISQTVAISAAIEEFFAHGKKYRNYRNTAEHLKIEGWQFFQLAGPYRQFTSHEAAYVSFAQRVEQYMQQDVQGFLAQLEESHENTKGGGKADADQALQLTIQQLNQRLEGLSFQQPSQKADYESGEQYARVSYAGEPAAEPFAQAVNQTSDAGETYSEEPAADHAFQNDAYNSDSPQWAENGVSLLSNNTPPPYLSFDNRA